MRRIHMKAIAASLIAMFAFSPAAFAHECANKDEIIALFTKWNAALQTGNPDSVADLYAADGVLLPTVSNKVRVGHQAIAAYFHHFLEMKPVGTLDEEHVFCFGTSIAINEGIYTFGLTKDGKSSKVQARYSYVYHKEHGEWKIVSHHSSRMPEPVAGK